MQGVTNRSHRAAYTHLANAPLASQIAFRSNTLTRMTTTKSHVLLNRMTSIASVPSGTGILPVSYHYAYNTANQRTALTKAGPSHWVWTRCSNNMPNANPPPCSNWWCSRKGGI